MKKILLLAATIFCFLNFANAQAGELDPSFGKGASQIVVSKNSLNLGNQHLSP